MALGPELVSNELNGLAKRVFATGVVDQEQRLTITYDSLPDKNWNLGGAGWFGDAHMIRSSSFKFSNPSEHLSQETTEQSVQFNITSKQMDGQVALTKDFIVKIVGGATSFESFTYKMDDLRRSMAKNLNQACYIGPTMLRATVAANSGPAATITVNNVQYVFRGEYVDIYDAAGTVIVYSNLQISNVNPVTNVITFTTNVTVTTGQTIYHHEENLNASSVSGKGLQSLSQICDDVTDYAATFENISRSTYPQWSGNLQNEAGNPLSNDVLQRANETLMNVAGIDYMLSNYVNFVNPQTIRRYLPLVLPQKRYVNASKYDSGMEKPNMLEWNGKGIVQDPDCGKRDWFMINLDHVGKVELFPLGVESTLGGATMKWKSGYMQGTTLFYFSGQVGTDRCNANVRIKDLQAI